MSAFGIGGTNAHAVLEQAPTPTPTPNQAGPQLIVLSARSQDRLLVSAHNLTSFLETNNPNLADLAYTLQTGRVEMKYRVAFISKDTQELRQQLTSFTENKKTDGQVYIGSAEGIDVEGFVEGNLEQIAKAWIKGSSVDWMALYQDAMPARINLPSYPFEPKPVMVIRGKPDALQTDIIHPMVQRNISTFAGQRFTSTFNGREFFLVDHVMAGRKVLPGVAYLEMARIALATALGDGAGHITLRKIVWVQPLEVEGPVEIQIAFDSESYAFEIVTFKDGEQIVHGRGLAESIEFVEPIKADFSEPSGQRFSGADCYRRFEKGGADYGTAFQCLESLTVGESEAVARLVLPEAVRGNLDSYGLHPGLLDSGVQAAFLAMDIFEGDNGVSGSLPFELGKLEIFGNCDPVMWALARRSAGSGAGDKVQRMDLDLCSESGEVKIRFSGLARIMAETSNIPLLRPIWQDAPVVHGEKVPEGAVIRCTEEDPEDAIVSTLMSLKKIALSGVRTTVQIVVSTSGTLPFAMAGLVETARIEHPEKNIQLIASNDDDLTGVLAENRCHPEDGFIRYENGNRQVRVFEALEHEHLPQNIPWRERGVYLITGGVGALGRIFAQEIFDKTQDATVILLGRSELKGERQSWFEQKRTEGQNIEYLRSEYLLSGNLETTITDICQRHGRLHGILHCAGVLDDGLLLSKTEERVRAVLSPKIGMTKALDAATRDLNLDMFVLFSSVSALGSLGQADYAAANGFLDGFAVWRQEEVLRGNRNGHSLSIAWPLWRDGGMRPDPQLLNDVDLKSLKTKEGLQYFYQALESGETSVLVGTPPVKEHKETEMPVETVGVDRGALAEKIQTEILVLITELIGVPADDIDPGEEFNAFGFDSISLTQMATRLNSKLGLELTPAVFFQYTSVNSLIEHLIEEQGDALTIQLGVAVKITSLTTPLKTTVNKKIRAQIASTSVPPVTSKVTSGEQRKDVAIIGMSGCFPMAEDLSEFWENLVTGRDCITEVPDDRWDWRAIFGDPATEANKTDIKWGGFIDGVANFDPLFFGISPREAETMDPQQRLLMSHVWLTLEEAGYSRTGLAGSDTGIFVGMGASDYGTRVLEADGGIQGHTLMGLLPSMAPSRMSYFMDWHGPSEFIDTACSSSLVALHRAVRAIRSGECQAALTGGVMAMLSPTSHIGFSKAGMLSRDGRCKTFSEAADGYVRGEGVGLVMLKDLTQAEADGDHIHGVIKGTAVNHGGRANTLTSPNPNAQAALIKTACADAGIDARDIGYIEAHGTGTKLGDPVEINGLKAAFAELHPEGNDGSCGIGSVKTNIGHLELASGIAGLIKVLLQMKHHTLAPSLHCDQLNPYIDLDESHFDIVRESRPWLAVKDENGVLKQRLAGVSSFGFGGVNAHVILEEYTQPETAAVIEEPAIIVVSAKGKAQLATRAQDLLGFLETTNAGGQDKDESRANFLEEARNSLAEILDVAAEEISDDEPFETFGLDVMARNQLATETGVSVATVFGAESLSDLTTQVLGNAPRSTEDISLYDLAFTLQTGREPMEHRLAFVSVSCAELCAKLTAFLNTGSADSLYKGQVKAGKSLSTLTEDEDMQETAKSWVRKRKYGLLAKLWVEGLDLPWQALYESRTPQRISLPGNPFAYRHCWIEINSENKSGVKSELDTNLKGQLLAPIWDRVEPRRRSLQSAKTLVSGIVPDGLSDAIIANGDEIPVDGYFGHIVFVASNDGDDLLKLFRLIKKILTWGYDVRDLAWTVVTSNGLALGDGRELVPDHAAIHGFMTSVAAEYPHWKVRLLDFSRDWIWTEVADLPFGSEALCESDGQWFQRQLAPIDMRRHETTPYREGGVYVVLGGAGGLGEVWSRHVIERHKAKVVWIGRRPLDAKIQASIDTLAKFGPAPVYLQADATNVEDLDRARSFIRGLYPRIHGLLHSTLVLEDRGVAAMDEAALLNVFAAKADTARAMTAVFSGEKLDFLAVFSSMTAFGKAPGQSNYAAGSAYLDALAQQLDQRWNCPVKVMNWGYWGSVGSVANDAIRARMEKAGIGSIEPVEGMAALDQLLAGPFNQLAYVKERMATDKQGIRLLEPALPSVIKKLSVSDRSTPKTLFPDIHLENIMSRLMAANMRGDVLPKYRNWLEQSQHFISSYSEVELENAQSDWVAAIELRKGTPEIELLDLCLKALPDVLSGRIKATDVMFPDASLALVEKIYKGNPVADLFNDTLSDLVTAYVRERGGQPLRILEIGAGTGGTSVTVLRALKPFGAQITEYAYTDVSKAFLLQAEDRFGTEFPSLRTMMFDVEKNPEEQGVPTGHYDFVIAANVLHATSDIRTSLKQAKVLLKRNGLLLLNEISGTSLFTHLTFGLLEGWWRYRDTSLRVPGSPALASETWMRVLNSEGFRNVSFPLDDHHGLGQQLVIAESDGVVSLSKGVAVERTSNQVEQEVVRLPVSENISGNEDTGVNIILKELSQTLKIGIEEIELDIPFSDYGIDSILGIGFAKALGDRFGIELNTTVLFDHTTVERLAIHLAQHSDLYPTQHLTEILEEQAPVKRVDQEPSVVSVHVSETIPARAQELKTDIAVIGMAAQVPGATDVESFWRNLTDGVEGVTRLGGDYLAAGGDANASCQFGGILEERACFDPQFFNISPREAKSMNPHQRLIMLEGWKAMEDAGYDPKSLADLKVGCFVGAEPAGYFHETFTGSSDAIIASRLAYFLNLKGPTMVINTGCSSSGTALHLACESLRHGESDMVLAGGVFACLGETGLDSLAQLDMLSPSGRCHTFDADADGTVFAEAAGMVLLKRLDDAERDGDPIHGVIAASGINQDGASNGITAPNGDAQERLILSTYEKFGINPDNISYVETHGTGTPLGDPLEANALVRAFRSHTSRIGYCTIGSAKAHIGHAAAGAGVIGLIKILLSLKHGEIPALLNFKHLNPLIKFDGSPFVVPKVNQVWAMSSKQRFAALNCFGHSGTNVHMVVRDHRHKQTSDAVVGDRRPYLFPLSATSPERLVEYIHKLEQFLDGTKITARDLAYTLQVGRVNLKHRACFVAQNFESLREQLLATIAGSSSSSQSDEFAVRWERGEAIDWNSLYVEPKPQRINIPTYPFSKTRYWMTEKIVKLRKEFLHPLVQTNISTIEGLRYRTRFSGSEPFFRDHLILKKSTLPGVAYLEMARAAFDLSCPGGETARRLTSIVWVRPITADVEDVEITLIPLDEGRIRFKTSSAEGVHCQGTISAVGSEPVAVQDVKALKDRMTSENLDGAECYRLFENMGIHYGATHQGIEALYLGEDEVLAHLKLSTDDGMVLSPGLMDSALQATLGVNAQGGKSAFVPYALEAMSIHAPCQDVTWAWVRLSKGPVVEDLRKYDIDLLDDNGLVCVRFEGLAFRSVADDTVAENTSALIWEEVWQKIPDATNVLKKDVVLHTVVIEDGVHNPVLVDDSGSLFERINIDTKQQNPAIWYGRVVTDLVRSIKSIMADKKQKHMLRVIVPIFGPATLLTGVSGLLKTAALEYSRLSTQLIELDGSANLHNEGAPHVRFLDGERLLPSWQECNVAGISTPWRERGVYLITGGLGGIGMIVATEIAMQTDSVTLVLCGRSALDAETETKLNSLRGLGTEVVYHQLDVSDGDAVDRIVRTIVEYYGALHGILHTAGLLRDGYILAKDDTDINAVLAPKVAGALNLDRSSLALDLDIFVLFSAAAGCFGNPGQVDYAAANGFLDAFATWRNGQKDRSGHTCAIDWPLWAEGGMQISEPLAEAFEAQSGVQPLSSKSGMEALYRSLSSGADRLLVLAGNPERLRSWITSLHKSTEDQPEAVVPNTKHLKQIVRRFLQEGAAEILELDASDLDPRDELSEYGFDSITFMELTNHVNNKFRLDFAPTLFFEYPTIDKVTTFLLEDALSAVQSSFESGNDLPTLKPTTVAEPKITAAPADKASKQSNRGVAIIGMSGRLPGAEDIDSFWEILSEGRDCISDVPPERWDWRAHWGDAAVEPGKTKVKRAGFIKGIGEFDPLFFGISPREAELMDPQQRLLMTHAWASIEDAGYAPGSLAGSNTAIFVGTAPSGYAKRIEEAGLEMGGHSSTGSTASVGPNRISYLLDLHGPSEPVETACSSGLVAIHRAIGEIRLGRTETALAGGINCIVLPEVHASFDAAGMLSPDGTCKTFSRHANGYGRGEGAAMVFLKDLEAAERDGDPIHAVIIGSAENHGGRASSLTAPNPKAQASLLKDAIHDAGVDPATIGYIETHGTGTELGDPIEIQGITDAYRDLYNEAGHDFIEGRNCGLGSVKSNVGHLELAAGVAGLIKVVLQMRHKTLVPSLHSVELNPFIKLEGSPFHVVTESQPWETMRDSNDQEIPRRAGLSSFGFGGVNAHLVIEEYRTSNISSAEDAGPVMIVLSAKDGPRLKDVARNLLVATFDNNRPNLRDLAFTLQVGREPLEERVAFEVDTYSRLHNILQGVILGETPSGVYRGRARFDNEAVNMFDDDGDKLQTVKVWQRKGEIIKLLKLWVEGLDFDWLVFYQQNLPKRVRLPVYPFARENFWISPQDKTLSPESVVPLEAGVWDLHDKLLDKVISGECSADEAVRLVQEQQG
ncbi:MAG: SDR family NAD(P)-dependent oxidoreductase [Halopseudomonas aestusnigri]